MSARRQSPPIDERKASSLERLLRAAAPRFTPEWPARDEDDFGVALIKIFSFIAEGVIQRLNRAPFKNWVAFLDSLGIRQLPAVPSRAPVQFRVALGTESEFLVPQRTKMSSEATPEREELPFETEEALWATPSPLKQVVAIDPVRDAIYAPPGGFLEQDRVLPQPPAYRIVSFSSQDTRTFQLDRVDGLEKEGGDLLRIETQSVTGAQAFGICTQPRRQEGSGPAADHYIIESIEGELVTLKSPLLRDYGPETPVEKVSRFRLFESKNLQQHILYLGHPDLFNVKSEAEFTLHVTHLAGSQAGLAPLRLAWEYFGEEKGQQGDAWRAFQVDDGTNGLSSDGSIGLTKGQGEIKQSEVNLISSRWIRCRLLEPIPASPPRQLPALDQITCQVKSAAALPADQGFNNDTPLDVNLTFLPFGSQPRSFDTFYLASQEIFSKKGAEIVIGATFDLEDLLAAPSAVFFEDQLRVFARGAAGRLLELELNPDPSAPSSPGFEDHDFPPDTEIALKSSPSTIVDRNGQRIFVLVRAENGRIYLRFFNGVQWDWSDLGTPADGEKISDPSVALDKPGDPHVFVTADGDLHFLILNSQDGSIKAPGWSQGPPTSGFSLSSAPFATSLLDGAKFSLQVFATDTAGAVQQWEATGPFNWVTLGTPPPAAESARPFAQIYFAGLSSRVRVFIRDQQNLLRIYDPGTNTWPPSAPPMSDLASDPHGFIVEPGTTSEKQHIFARAADNRLWEWDGSTWLPRGRPGDSELQLAPFVVPYLFGAQLKQRFLSVFSASNKNSILEFRIRIEDKIGKADGGPLETIILSSTASSNSLDYQGFYIAIIGGQGTDSVLRQIAAYGGFDRTALVTPSWGDVPDQTSRYQLFSLVQSVNSIAAGSNTITLGSGVSGISVGMWIYAGGDLREILAYTTSNVATVAPWSGSPPPNAFYQVLNLEQESFAQDGASGNIILDAASASPKDQEYKDASIRIPGTGQNSVARRIASYSGRTRIARAVSDWDPLPAVASMYEIGFGFTQSLWLEHEDPDESELRPELSWEYWNGRGWTVLKVVDSTLNFLKDGTVVFELPQDIESTEVSGQENFWIRARIVGGDFGQEVFSLLNEGDEQQLIASKRLIKPPRITKLEISYRLLQAEFPQHCIPFNNLEYLDQSAANRTEGKRFLPFAGLPETRRSIYLGFEKAFQGGPIRIFFAAQELPFSQASKPKIDWTFRAENEWQEVDFQDATQGLIKQEILELNVPQGFQVHSLFGGDLYWIKGSLVEGEYQQTPVLSGIFPNTAWAFQAETIRDEILGSSDGEPDQEFEFFAKPVLPGQQVRVREVLTEEEREALIAAQGEEAVLEVRDQQGRLQETWVLWSEAEEFFDSQAESRHYKLDRANGKLFFGDGKRGAVPAAGADNIQAFVYQAGGGAAGNVKTGQISALADAVAGVESVLNPVEAGGGSDKASLDQMLDLGPAQISHRDRAVSCEDFEWLARQASRQVAKVRCLANTNNLLQKERGWVSLFIVPDSLQDKPQPSLELLRTVRRSLQEKSHPGLSGQGQIVAARPRYVEVSLSVDLYAVSIDQASKVEKEARSSLRKFLHPLTGGPEGEGWEFGRDVAASDVYALLEGIGGVDHAENLEFSFQGQSSTEGALIGPDALVANGKHSIQLKIAKEG